MTTGRRRMRQPKLEAEMRSATGAWAHRKISIGPFNIQKYSSGDHFSRLHSERTSINTLHRLFAWMTYLNDVKEENGGTTDFDSYKIKVKPEQGKTLIWPAEWTHAHYGSILKSGEKFIITGWIDFKV